MLASKNSHHLTELCSNYPLEIEESMTNANLGELKSERNNNYTKNHGPYYQTIVRRKVSSSEKLFQIKIMMSM